MICLESEMIDAIKASEESNVYIAMFKCENSVKPKDIYDAYHDVKVNFDS